MTPRNAGPRRLTIVAAYVAAVTGDAALAEAPDAAVAADARVAALLLDCALATGFSLPSCVAGWFLDGHCEVPRGPPLAAAELRRRVDAVVAFRDEALATPTATAALLADPFPAWLRCFDAPVAPEVPVP